MKVEYLFSNSNKLGSKLIAWSANFEKLGLDDNPSHVAVLLNDNLVIESTFFSGVRIIPYTKWLDINNEVARIPCANLYRPSMDVFKELTSLWGKSYDWLGIIYFAYRYLKLALFKEKLPKVNKFQKPNSYFCTEFVAILSGCDCSMMSPAKLLQVFSEEKHGV